MCWHVAEIPYSTAVVPLWILHISTLRSHLSLVLPATRPKESEGLPDSIKRVGQAEAFPNEYPGQVYAFNWCLNGDGVTPLRRSAFRITKPLDLKVAGLTPPKKSPLQVRLSRVSYFFMLDFKNLNWNLLPFLNYNIGQGRGRFENSRGWLRRSFIRTV